jgi:hypothetical protein
MRRHSMDLFAVSRFKNSSCEAPRCGKQTDRAVRFEQPLQRACSVIGGLTRHLRLSL